MNDQQQTELIRKALEQGGGVVRLMPTWVPRSFCVPGRRLRLHPNDLYALGAARDPCGRVSATSMFAA